MFDTFEVRRVAGHGARGFLPLLLGAMLIAAAPGSARADEADGPREFLASLTSQAIDQLANTSITMDERKRKFRILFTRNFDIPTIGRFVLGRYWRAAGKAVQQDFLEVFEDVMVERFAPEFASRAGSYYEIGVVRKTSRANQFIVTSTIEISKERILKVDWRVRRKDTRYKVLDVIGEGVSMALTLRSEYASVIKKNSGKVEGLVKLLRQRIRGGSESETSSAAN